MYNVVATFTAIDRMTGVVNGIAKNMGTLETRAGKIGSEMSSVGSALTKGLTLPLVAAGAGALEMSVDFDAALRNIQSVSKQTDAEIAALGESFLSMSRDASMTTDSATGLADAFYNIQGSGFEGAAAMEVLARATKAASAGLTEAEVASAAMTAKLNAYGESADQAAATSDLMFRTVDRGVGTFEELAGSLSNCMGTAANAGVSFDVVSAAMATMSKQGISFSEAGTALNALILSLLTPSENLAEVFKKMSYESGEAAMNSLGLVGTLDALTTAGYDTTAELDPLLGNVRALRAALALTGKGAEMFKEDLAAMGSAAGATDAAFEIQSKSMRAQSLGLRNELGALAIDVGNILLPALRDFVGMITSVVEWFGNLPAPVKEAVVHIGMLAAVLGPLLKIGGSLVSSLGSLVGGFQKLGSVLGLASPQLLAVAAAAIAVSAAYAKLKEFQNIIKEGQEEVNQTLVEWTDNTRSMMVSGANVGEVMDEYARRITNAARAHDEGGVIADIFVSKQATIGKAVGEAAYQAAQASGDYNEYLSSVERLNAQLPIGTRGAITYAQAQEMAARMVTSSANAMTPAAAMTRVLENNTVILTEAQWQAVQSSVGLFEALSGLPGLASDVSGAMSIAARQAAELAGGVSSSDEAMLMHSRNMRAAAEAAEELAKATEEALRPTMEADAIYQQLIETYDRLGLQQDAFTQRNEDAAIGLGLATEASAKLDSDVRLVSEAYAQGTMSLEAYSGYVQAAQNGTLNLSQAQIEGISHASNWAQAQRDAAAAADEHRLKLLGLSEQMMNIGAQQMAQTALQDLQTRYDAGMMSLDTYEAAVINVQDAYGLATPQSRALAEGMLELNDLLVAGAVAPADYATAVEAMRAASENGATTTEDLMTAVENAVGPFDRAAGSLGGYAGSADAAATASDRAAAAADRARAALEGMTSKTWVVSVGTAGTLPPGVAPIAMQHGMWEVPRTGMLAMLHQGEMVLPAGLAEAVREGLRDGRAGGTTVNNYNLSYTGNRYENGRGDAAGQMREIEIGARLRR